MMYGIHETLEKLSINKVVINDLMTNDVIL